MQQLFLFAKCKCRQCKEWVYLPNNGPISEYCEWHYIYHYLQKFEPNEYKILVQQYKRKLRNKNQKLRQKTDHIFRIRGNLYHRVKELLKHKPYERSSRIGCTGFKLRKHLESKFTPEMSWNNYGTYWHVDHIRPLASFNLLNPIELMQANHYTNLQPLSAKDNIKKGSHYVRPI